MRVLHLFSFDLARREFTFSLRNFFKSKVLPFRHKRLYIDLIFESFHHVRYRIERFFVDKILIILLMVEDNLEEKCSREKSKRKVRDEPKRSSIVGIVEPFLIVTFFAGFVAEPG